MRFPFRCEGERSGVRKMFTVLSEQTKRNDIEVIVRGDVPRQEGVCNIDVR